MTHIIYVLQGFSFNQLNGTKSLHLKQSEHIGRSVFKTIFGTTSECIKTMANATYGYITSQVILFHQ